MSRRFLKAFGRAQRPVAWTIMVLSLLVFVSIVSTLWKVPDKPSALLGAFLLLWEGWSAVTDVENAMETEGQAE